MEVYKQVKKQLSNNNNYESVNLPKICSEWASKQDNFKQEGDVCWGDVCAQVMVWLGMDQGLRSGGITGNGLWYRSWIIHEVSLEEQCRHYLYMQI